MNIGELEIGVRYISDTNSLTAALRSAETTLKGLTVPIKFNVEGGSGLSRLSTAITELSDKFDVLGTKQRVVIQEVSKVDAATTTAARGVGILASQVQTARVDIEAATAQIIAA